MKELVGAHDEPLFASRPLRHPDDKGMEEISDETIDVAGHMQKYAAPASLWIGKEVLTELESSAGFEEVTTQMVDGRVPYEWKLRTTAKAVSST